MYLFQRNFVPEQNTVIILGLYLKGKQAVFENLVSVVLFQIR